MSQTSLPPKTRKELLSILAIEIGWGETATDLENELVWLESIGVSMVPTQLLPQDFVNPYAPKKD